MMETSPVCDNRGMAMGPMALGDLVGQELFWKQRKVPFPHWAKVDTQKVVMSLVG